MGLRVQSLVRAWGTEDWTEPLPLYVSPCIDYCLEVKTVELAVLIITSQYDWKFDNDSMDTVLLTYIG